MKRVFLDTNLIVYAVDNREGEKHQRAAQLIADLLRSRSGVLSTQVLQEYASVALGKLHQDLDVVLRQMDLLETLEVVQITPALVRRGLELSARYRINYWDAAIVAAAEHARCEELWSEDLNPAAYASVRVENPLIA